MSSNASDAVLARLMGLHPKKIDLSLGRMQRLLNKLGNPEKKLPPVVHIAGTNGKGSTVATLRAFAEAAGHRVHVYTSPHLVRFNERIRVAGQLIHEDDLTALLKECERANGPDAITFFEVTTAAAILAFSREPADLCILEVGLGGRLDATNVVAHPVATGITPVSLDHQQFLGNTVTDIAGEKAGIIKTGAPLVVGPQSAEGLTCIKAVAATHGVKPKLFGRDWQAKAMPGGKAFLYEDWRSAIELPMPVLPGAHQISNAGMAIALAHAQDAVNIPEAAIRAGLGWVRWPARLQELKHGTYNDLLPEGATLMLDGGHNPGAAEVIRDYLKRVDTVANPATLIIGMMGTKDAPGYLKQLVGLVERVIAVPIEGEEGAANPAALAAAATDVGISGVLARDVPSALKLVAEKSHADRPPFVLIGGSLYLAGNVLREIGEFPA
ncbi:MAG: bifunctional folylpolyglutamate synthase/dihydrofolate synthase [Alphaproteobacteria bacterium]|nr:MAG: bifunctional folylpolyglutamate synthase/dihydrofolate synthase [Alphaproteobacteria bacterium]